MAARSNTDKFLVETEQQLKAALSHKPNFVVWRGNYPHKHISESFEYETVLVGLADDKDVSRPPSIILAQLWLDHLKGLQYDIDTGNDQSSSGRVGFWNDGPTRIVNEVVEKLKNYSF